MTPDDATRTDLPAAAPPATPATPATLSAVVRPSASGTLSFVGPAPSAPSDSTSGGTGYELLEELGRGAMGVVYKARDLRLSRVVALKMVRGERADARHLVRFLAEAEAAAAVRHPNVVQVYEFGETDGRPFIALEYLSGGTLDARLGAPLAPRSAVELLDRIARGVAAAHDGGVVHRDLKPGNVLFDAFGAPKVADFGLAKRVAVDLTATQAVMGTPAYMAPEQAGGNARFVGPTADVWALGVILYEMLTGARPFVGDDVQSVLAAVILAEPKPPRQIVPAIPRDLERVCLKCLSKLPHERYATANELAADLARYLRGEPVSVRPAGPLERGYKWAKRNKVVSGAAAAVFLALVTGSAVSLGFGLEARRQATVAEEQRKNAETAAERERDEAARAEREKADAVAARVELRGTLVKALLGPLATRDPHREPTAHEREMLWQIARQRRTEVGRALLDEATRSPLVCDQLATRGEYLLHAAVGLDARRRDEVEAQFLARLRPNPHGHHAFQIACAVACWGARSPDLNAAAADVLLAELIRNKDAAARRRAALYLSAAAKRMAPTAAAGVCKRAADVLAEAYKDEFNDTASRNLAKGLVATTEPMDPDAALLVLLTAIKKASHSSGTAELAEGLAAAAERAEPAVASKACAAAVDSLAPQVNRDDIGRKREARAATVMTLAERIDVGAEPEVCANAVRELTEALYGEGFRKDDVIIWSNTPEAIVAVAARMDAAAAVAALITAADKPTDVVTRDVLAGTLPPLAAATFLSAAAEQRIGDFGREKLIAGLADVADRLEPAVAVATLRAALRRITNFFLRDDVAVALSREARRIPPDAAADLLIAALEEEENWRVRGELAKGLAAVANQLEPTAAKKVCARTARLFIAKPLDGDQFDRKRAFEGLAALAAHLPPKDAAAMLGTVLKGEKELWPLYPLVEGLAAVAARLDPAAAAVVCAEAADATLAAQSRVEDHSHWPRLARVLTIAVGRANAAVAAKARADAALFLTALREERSGHDRRFLTEGLVVLATGMDPKARTEIVDILLAALRDERDDADRKALADGLVKIAAGQPPSTAGRALAAALAEYHLTAFPASLELRPDISREPEYVWVSVEPLDSAFDRAVCEWKPSDEGARNAAALAAGAFATPYHVLPSLPLLSRQFPKRPKPLPPRELVELLKHPFCVGEARRTVLDALQVTYKRPFKDLWEFVEYAQTHQPHLDLLTPPERTEPKP